MLPRNDSSRGSSFFQVLFPATHPRLSTVIARLAEPLQSPGTTSRLLYCVRSREAKRLPYSLHPPGPIPLVGNGFIRSVCGMHKCIPYTAPSSSLCYSAQAKRIEGSVQPLSIASRISGRRNASPTRYNDGAPSLITREGIFDGLKQKRRATALLFAYL